MSELGLKSMGWGTFDKGILSGTVTPERKFDENDARSWAPWWKKSSWREKAQKVQDLISNGLDVRLAALHFSLANLDCALVGCKSVKQIEDLAKMLKQEISLAEINNIYEQLNS